MNFSALSVPPLGALCYIIKNENGDAAVIDPGGDAPSIMKAVEEDGGVLKMILCTHGHFDHVGAIGAILEKHNVPVYLHRLDYPLLLSAPDVYIQYGMGAIKPPRATEFFDNDTELDVVGYNCKVLCTPGHTPGSVSYYFKTKGCVFTGDTLFRDSVGRTDLGGGSAKDLENSIKSKLYTLAGDTVVYPGHGISSKIGYEKKNNPFVQG